MSTQFVEERIDRGVTKLLLHPHGPSAAAVAPGEVQETTLCTIGMFLRVADPRLMIEASLIGALVGLAFHGGSGGKRINSRPGREDLSLLPPSCRSVVYRNRFSPNRPWRNSRSCRLVVIYRSRRVFSLNSSRKIRLSRSSGELLVDFTTPPECCL